METVYRVVELKPPSPERTYLVCWDGEYRVPVGAVVCGYSIASMRQDMVWGKLEGQIVLVGAYERLVEFGKKTGRFLEAWRETGEPEYRETSHVVLIAVKDPQ
jgi:hypothetical protein